MDMQTVIKRAERNIRQALRDYRAHTDKTEVLDDVSDAFITRLARDSSYAKQELRELFSKSLVWCEDIDALVINGTRTHNPDYTRIRNLAWDILAEPRYAAKRANDSERYADIEAAIEFFANPSLDQPEFYTAAINRLAPKAYAPGKKLSRVFKALCTKLGVADETAGSQFQHLYAQFADELTARKIGFKLYISINPAHFLTMSNPKCDKRGSTLTSCHSFNSTEYEYNNGCSGYARDNYTFIVFTVDDPSNPETLNNRKTTRQIFAYKPGNGLLLQSRMYNTSGGVYGAAEDSKLYRDLVQREISMLEEVPNLWKTCNFCGSDFASEIFKNEDFGGYPDWTYENFDAHVSVRRDRENDYEGFEIGAAGLCICCGDEINTKLYCDGCLSDDDEENYCEHCENYTSEELYEVHDSRGRTLMVCEDCRNSHYTQCEDCDEWYPNDSVYSTANGRYVCDDCRENYSYCEECDELYCDDDMYLVHDENGIECRVCCDCLDEHYMECQHCHDYHYNKCVIAAYQENGDLAYVCDDCAAEYEECPHCGELVKVRDDGTCPHCGAVIDENEEEVESGKEHEVA